ncbi:anti-sigma factor [Microlunatus flavus]|uniref:Putative zinc-finger n=1 Tax=Microlunatus flavus TaxID=1036181 RepID=A0A1H9N9C5_9ACTN|nr:zf-HC2 domain-containing protein [Microlunatus flavus]SER32512.1 Putative zinc-finger [Microlunatus flavus]
MSTDRYAQWDAAYVLGALAPDERAEFEEHLAGCARCREAVGELAGMPGLLAQVPASEVWDAEPAAPGPSPVDRPVADHEPTREVVPLDRRRALRPRWWQVAAAAVLVAVLGGLAGYVLRPVVGQPAAQRLAFSVVEPSPLTAVVDLAPAGAGTEVRVECQYADADEGEAYSVWVVGQDGSASEVKPWTARPNRVMHPSGTSPLRLDAIAAVEIRSGDAGSVLLRARR